MTGRPAIDLTGSAFGRLTVVARAGKNYPDGHAAWICVCQCGRETIVPSNSLRRGDCRSCGCLNNELRAGRIASSVGMHHRIDLTSGLRSGRLRVVAFGGIERSGPGRRWALWTCRCECDAEVVVRGSSLSSGETRSCGCLSRDLTRERNAWKCSPMTDPIRAGAASPASEGERQ